METSGKQMETSGNKWKQMETGANKWKQVKRCSSKTRVETVAKLKLWTNPEILQINWKLPLKKEEEMEEVIKHVKMK